MENVTPIRQADAAPSKTSEQASRPQNIEAEQALLGILLVDPTAFGKISEIIKATHFFDPVHGYVFNLIAQKANSDRIATPITLAPAIQDHPGIAELGGKEYLVRLANAAISIHACQDYAEQIRDLSMRRELMDLGHQVVQESRTVDPSRSTVDLIAETERKLYDLGENGKMDSEFAEFVTALHGAVSIAKRAATSKRKIAGQSTGLGGLDRMTGGLHESDLIILAGRPAMGKTALATNIAFHIASTFRKAGTGPDGTLLAQLGGIVGFFSLEMSSTQLAQRLLSESSGISSIKIRNNEIDGHDFDKYCQAARALSHIPLYIDDTPALTIAQIGSRARRQKRKLGLDVLIVDYLQLIRPRTQHNNRVNEVAEVTQGLKAIAKELNIPVIAISQLSRNVDWRDDKRPVLSDLRDSGSIEQDADIVMFVFREEYYLLKKKPDESDEKEIQKWQSKMDKAAGTAEIIIDKHRNGATGSVHLAFHDEITKFSDLNDSHAGGSVNRY